MNREELISSIEKIGTCEDENERRSLLDTLNENVGKVFDEVDLLKNGSKTLEDKLKTKEEELTTAQKYNMEMFLKLQEQRKDDNVIERETGVKQEEKKEYKSYDELSKDYIK